MRFWQHFPLWGLGILLGAGSIQAHEPTRPALSNPDIVVPLDFANRTPYVRVMVKGRSFWFVLDTGNKYAVIELSIAKSLGLELGAPVPIQGGGSQTKTGFMLVDSHFGLPQLQGFSQPLTIAVPLENLAQASGHEFAGILGFDFISKFIVEIDYAAEHMILHEIGHPYRGAAQKLPISFNNSGHPVVTGQIIRDSGAPAVGHFVLDTGSGAALILNTPFVQEEEFLQSSRPTIPWLEGLAFGGRIDGRVGRIRGLKLGRYTIRDPVTVFSQAGSGPFAAPDVQGNIGAAILEQFTLVLDYGRKEIFLAPNQRFGAPIQYNRTGLVLVATGNAFETVKVASVAEHSPASEANVLPGDLLISVDDHPVHDLSLSQLRTKFQEVAECTLIIERNGERHAVRLHLRGLI